MNRAEYIALRRAAFDAAQAYRCEADSDGRSSYASHGIRCTHALNEWQRARNAVPHADESLATVRRINRRRRVIECIRQRNHARERTPSCLPYYQRQLRAALYRVEG